MGSIQPQWRLIDQTLDHIYSELVKHPAFTGTGGPNPGSVKFQDNWAKLDRYAQILKTSMRTLRSSQSLIDLQMQAAKKIPREHRYSVNQSLRARQGNLDNVHAKALSLLRMLEKMAENYGKPDFGSLDKLFDQAEDGVLAIISDTGHMPEPGIGGPTHPTAAMPIHTLLAFIVFYLVHLRNRSKD